MQQFAKDVAEVTARVSSRLQHSRIFFANLSELRKSMADELADDDEEAKESDSCLLQQGSSRRRGRSFDGVRNVATRGVDGFNVAGGFNANDSIV